jgi:hypothetical protein
MAVMTLLANGSNNVSGDWITVGAGISDPHEALVSNDNGTSYVKCNDHDEAMIIEYANPSVASGDIASIESVQFLSVGKSSHRSSPSIVSIEFETPSGNIAELCSYDAHRTSYETINGTARAATPIGGSWTYANLENMEMKCTKDGTVEVYLSYLALEVTYTEAVTADNSTFFGANF